MCILFEGMFALAMSYQSDFTATCRLVPLFIHNLKYPPFELFGDQPFDTTMGLEEARLELGIVCGMAPLVTVPHTTIA